MKQKDFQLCVSFYSGCCNGEVRIRVTVQDNGSISLEGMQLLADPHAQRFERVKPVEELCPDCKSLYCDGDQTGVCRTKNTSSSP